jgi:hypothetical protein
VQIAAAPLPLAGGEHQLRHGPDRMARPRWMKPVAYRSSPAGASAPWTEPGGGRALRIRMMEKASDSRRPHAQRQRFASTRSSAVPAARSARRPRLRRRAAHRHPAHGSPRWRRCRRRCRVEPVKVEPRRSNASSQPCSTFRDTNRVTREEAVTVFVMGMSGCVIRHTRTAPAGDSCAVGAR